MKKHKNTFFAFAALVIVSGAALMVPSVMRAEAASPSGTALKDLPIGSAVQLPGSDGANYKFIKMNSGAYPAGDADNTYWMLADNYCKLANRPSDCTNNDQSTQSWAATGSNDWTTMQTQSAGVYQTALAPLYNDLPNTIGGVAKNDAVLSKPFDMRPVGSNQTIHPTAGRDFQVGMFDAPDENANSIPSSLAFEQTVGKKFDFMPYFSSLSNFQVSRVNTLLANDTDPYVELNIYFSASDAPNLDQIIASMNSDSGAYYTSISNVFSQLQATGQSDRMYLSIFAEHNTSNAPWSIFRAPNTPAKLQQAYRLVVDRARELGVQAKFVQAYNNQNDGTGAQNYSTPFSQSYAGDAYVDYAAIDFFNRYNISYSLWKNAPDTIGSSYAQITSFTAKPILIGGYNSAPSQDGFSRPQWIKDTAQLLMTQYPQVAGASLFSITLPSADWRLTSEQDLQAVKDAYDIFRSDSVATPFENRTTNNLSPYGDFTTLSRWGSNVGASIQFALDADVPAELTGQQSVKIHKNAHATAAAPSLRQAYFRFDDPTQFQYNTPYIVTFWAKASANNGVSMLMANAAGTSVAEKYDVPLTTQWQKYSFSVTNPIPDSNTGAVRFPGFGLNQILPAYDIWVAGMTVEPGFTTSNNVSLTANEAGCYLTAGANVDTTNCTWTGKISLPSYRDWQQKPDLSLGAQDYYNMDTTSPTCAFNMTRFGATTPCDAKGNFASWNPWTRTPLLGSVDRVWDIENSYTDRAVHHDFATNQTGVSPVLWLRGDIVINGGEGLYDDPYTIDTTDPVDPPTPPTPVAPIIPSAPNTGHQPLRTFATTPSR